MSTLLHHFKSVVFWGITLALSLAFSEGTADTPYILVTVAPHKFFVEKIGGNTVKVGLMVPAGASSHTYEPTPKQMIQAAKADIWFTIGETFEKRAGQALQSHNPSMQLIDMRQNLDMISTDSHGGHCQHCHHAHGQDLHIWLSARMAKTEAKTIADTLIARYPEHKQEYLDNLAQFTKELDQLDREIAATLKTGKHKVFMVSHPAYAYFCRDYGLQQLSIEFEGRDPTLQQLTTVLNRARQEGITTVFIQPQYNNKGARLIAKELGAQVVELDPYSENYMESMRQIARSIAGS